MGQRNIQVMRIFQKYMVYLQEAVIFKISHISPAGKISLLGLGLILFSLFKPWIQAEQSIIDGVTPIMYISSFSSLLGYVGVSITGLVLLLAFSILSLKRKQKLIFLGMTRIDEGFSTLFGGICIAILTFQSFLFINGLQLFSSYIKFGNGIVIAFIGIFFLLCGSYLYKKEYRKNTKGSYASEIDQQIQTQRHDIERKNMKLPF